MKHKRIMLLAVIAILIKTSGCRSTEFRGDNGAVSRSPKPTPTPTTTPNTPIPTTPPVIVPSISPTPVPPPVTVIECNSTTIKWANETTACPAAYAAYAIDDSKSTNIACCPLPTLDILATDAPVPRASQCGVDEVAVGGSSNGGLLCQRINTSRYALLAPKPTCYYGSGSAGGGGSASCGAPPATIQAMTARFGSDSCLPVPFGGLITGHKNNGSCASAFARVLVFKDTGMVVPTFK